MSERDSYCHHLRMDKWIRLATDNVSGTNHSPEYNPIIPPDLGYFLLLDNTPFLLLNGQNLDLL